MACDSVSEIHATIRLTMAICITFFSVISNSLFSFGLHKTKCNRFTNADKLFITQSVFDAMACLLYMLPITIRDYIATCAAMPLTGWTMEQFGLFDKVAETFVIITAIATSLPVVISLSRYIKVMEQRTVGTIIYTIFTVASVSALITSIIVANVGYLLDNLHLDSVSFTVYFASLIANLLLFIAINFHLLHHVLSQAMPTENRTHDNEKQITRTILIVNFCLLATWLPNSMNGVYRMLIKSGYVTASTKTIALLGNFNEYLRFGKYINGALNGLILMTRIARIRTYYKNMLIKTFCRANEEHETGHSNQTHY